MSEFFLRILNMSITAGWMILGILLFRRMFKNVPGFIKCIMWGMVAIRLICPVYLESPLSLIPSVTTVVAQKEMVCIDTGIEPIDDGVNDILIDDYVSEVSANEGMKKEIEEKFQMMDVICIVWIAGVFIIGVYSDVVDGRLKRKIAPSIRLRDNIYICDNISVPFVFGIFRPKIYIPSSVTEDKLEVIVDHEKAHIRNKDHIWKCLGYALLMTYWFNPLVWVGYKVFCKDLELACDERVIKNMTEEEKKTYSNALLGFNDAPKILPAAPTAFGEKDIKQRICKVLQYSRPKVGHIVSGAVMCLLFVVCFLSNPKVAIGKNVDLYDIPYEGLVGYGSETNVGVTLDERTGRFATFSPPRYEYCGYYVKTDDKLVLREDNEKTMLIFDIEGDTLIFDENNSVYEYWLFELKDGAKLTRGTFENGVFISNSPGLYDDCEIIDIDNDGTRERCFVGWGGTSGVASFDIAVMYKKNMEAYSHFHEMYANEFVISEDGKLQVRVMESYNDENGKLYEVTIENGNIVLIRDGERLEGEKDEPSKVYISS